MALSNQRIVSDGTLVTVDISFDFFEHEEISVFFNSAPQPPEGGVWYWGSEANISFYAPVPVGVEVLIQRKTDASELRHEFSAGSEFKATTLDENFQQVLHIVQEATESNFSKDFFDDINMNGNQIENLGLAVNDNQAVSLGQIKTESQGAVLANAEAKAARDKAREWAIKPTPVEGADESAKTYAGRAGNSATSAGTFSANADAKALAASQSASASASSATQSQSSASTSTAKASEAGGYAQDAAASAALAATFDPAKFVPQTSPTGVATLPTNSEDTPGSTAQIRFNDVKQRVEFWNGTAWSALGGGGSLFEYTWHNGPRASIVGGSVATDGQMLTQLQYPDTYADVIAGKQFSVPDATWQADVTQRNKWGIGNGWVRVPDLNGVTSGTGAAFYLRGSPSGLSGTSVTDAVKAHGHRVKGSNINQGNTTGYQIAIVHSSAAVGDKTGQSNYPEVVFRDDFVTDVVGVSAEENRVKSAYGVWCVRVATGVTNGGSVDVLQLATQVDALTQKVNAVTSQYVYFGGSEAAPTSLTLNSQLSQPNPFPGKLVAVRLEFKIGGTWVEPGLYTNNSGAYGALARYAYATDTVHAVSALTGTLPTANLGCSLSGSATSVTNPQPVRVLVWLI